MEPISGNAAEDPASVPAGASHSCTRRPHAANVPEQLPIAVAVRFSALPQQAAPAPRGQLPDRRNVHTLDQNEE